MIIGMSGVEFGLQSYWRVICLKYGIKPTIWSRETGQRMPCFDIIDHGMDAQYQRNTQ